MGGELFYSSFFLFTRRSRLCVPQPVSYPRPFSQACLELLSFRSRFGTSCITCHFLLPPVLFSRSLIVPIPSSLLKPFDPLFSLCPVHWGVRTSPFFFARISPHADCSLGSPPPPHLDGSLTISSLLQVPKVSPADRLF